MKKYLCWLAMLLILAYNGQSQNNSLTNSIKEIGIGEKIPDLFISNVVNTKYASINTRDFRGKMLILDFWATWCTPCVSLMPKMDSIQQLMSKEVQILPVTYQPKAEVQRLLSRSPKFKRITLPFVFADETLNKYFPHKELPHYVWIDSAGKVIAITGHNQITVDTIRMMLGKSKASLIVKKDVFKPYDREKAVLFQNLGYNENDVQFQSLLTGFKDGLNTRLDIIRNADGKIKKVTILNGYLQFLFRIAWSDETRFFSSSRVILEVKDTLKVTFYGSGDKFKEWLKDNAWTYELILPEHLSANTFMIMRTDIERFFPQYKVSVEKRMKRCLVLERTSAEDKLRSKGGEQEDSFDAYGIKMRNSSITLLVSQLNHYLQKLEMPVVDATGYIENADLQLDANITNISELRKAFQQYDLDLIEKDYEIEMLVIKDSKPGNERH